jgi:hypothetical protein
MKHGPGCTSKSKELMNKVFKVEGNPKKRIKALKHANYSIGIGLINFTEDAQNLPENCVLYKSDILNISLAKNDCLEHLKVNDYIFIIQNTMPLRNNWWFFFIENAILHGFHYSKQDNIQMFSRGCLAVCGGFNIDLDNLNIKIHKKEI